MAKDIGLMSLTELQALYVEKTEQMAKAPRIVDLMETGYARQAVIKEIGNLENEILEIEAYMDFLDNEDDG